MQQKNKSYKLKQSENNKSNLNPSSETNFYLPRTDPFTPFHFYTSRIFLNSYTSFSITFLFKIWNIKETKNVCYLSLGADLVSSIGLWDNYTGTKKEKRAWYYAHHQMGLPRTFRWLGNHILRDEKPEHHCYQKSWCTR